MRGSGAYVGEQRNNAAYYVQPKTVQTTLGPNTVNSYMHQSIVQPAVTNGFSITPNTITSSPLAYGGANPYPTTSDFNPVSIVVPALMP